MGDSEQVELTESDERVDDDLRGLSSQLVRWLRENEVCELVSRLRGGHGVLQLEVGRDPDQQPPALAVNITLNRSHQPWVQESAHGETSFALCELPLDARREFVK